MSALFMLEFFCAQNYIFSFKQILGFSVDLCLTSSSEFIIMNATHRILVFAMLILLAPKLDAQRILLVEKPGTFRNYKYFVGDDIIVKTIPYETKHDGVLHEITDTSILINFDNEIMLEDISMVMRRRWGWSLLSKVTRIAGAGYFALDVTNRLINGQGPVVQESTLYVSAGLVAFSYALVPIHHKRMRKGAKWRLKVLNMSMDEEVPNPFQK
jgi:hypothetical protein